MSRDTDTLREALGLAQKADHGEGLPREGVIISELMDMIKRGEEIELTTAFDPIPEPREDNWIHRARNMRCRTCMYYAPKETMQPGGPSSDVNALQEAIVGRCRRHAPTMNGWPVMFPDDWCGDHKLDENKA